MKKSNDDYEKHIEDVRQSISVFPYHSVFALAIISIVVGFICMILFALFGLL